MKTADRSLTEQLWQQSGLTSIAPLDVAESPGEAATAYQQERRQLRHTIALFKAHTAWQLNEYALALATFQSMLPTREQDLAWLAEHLLVERDTYAQKPTESAYDENTQAYLRCVMALMPTARQHREALHHLYHAYRQTEPLSGMALLPVSAGEFKMGSPEEEPERYDDEDQHRVFLSRPFWMGQYPVTQQQYQAVMKTSPSKFKGENLPVEQINWEDANAFCHAVTEAATQEDRIPADYAYRLPTEAEWEYCCRAGTETAETATAFGDSLDSTQANFDGNSPYGKAKKGVYLKQTSDVGQYAPNAWGLYDMHGNVLEWRLDCADFNEADTKIVTDTYTDDLTDPFCTRGSRRVYRGGGWFLNGRDCRSAVRFAITPDIRYDYLGFRACLAPSLTGTRDESQ